MKQFTFRFLRVIQRFLYELLHSTAAIKDMCADNDIIFLMIIIDVLSNSFALHCVMGVGREMTFGTRIKQDLSLG